MRDLVISRFGDQRPVLISPEHVGVVEGCLRDFARATASIDGMQGVGANGFTWHDQDNYLSRFQPYVVTDGVLQIPVKGVLIYDFPYTAYGMVTGYEYILAAFKRGMEDSSVRGIALVIDSPGGTVAGCFDSVDKMFALKAGGDKPVQAVVSEMACSAAYAIASLADQIRMTQTSMVGSIGVITMHIDQSKMLEDYGIKITVIKAGEHKDDGSPYAPLSDHARSRTQARVDEFYDVFVRTVARNRPALSEDAARESQADVYTASEATSNGFADSVGALDDQLAEFTASLNPEEGVYAMAENIQAEHEAALAAATTKAHADGLAAGAAAEKTRIQAILNSDAGKARPKAALAAALETDMSAETAINFIGRLAEEKEEAPQASAEPVSPMLKAMEQSGKVGLSAEAGDDADEGDTDVVALARAYGLAAFQPAQKTA